MTALPPAASEAIVHGNAVHAPVAELNVRFAGVGSVTLIDVASEGPLLVIVIAYVTDCPAATDAGPVLVTATSADVVIVELAVELLFVMLDSGVVVVTLTVFDADPVAFAASAHVLVNVTELPDVIVGIVHGYPPAHGAVFETNVRPAPGASLMVTFCASDGPRF